MSIMFKLRSWLTLDEAAKHLSTAFGEEVGVAGVLRLGLDGQLTISVNLLTPVRARKGHFVPLADAETMDLPSADLYSDQVEKRVCGIRFAGDQVLEFEEQVVSIDGVWDLPLLGREGLEVERQYQNLIGAPEPAKGCIHGPFVISPAGDYFQLKFESTKSRYRPGCLPDESMLVVRTTAINALLASLADAPLTKPLEERERATLLTIIAALAKEVNIDISMRSKAADLIERLTTQLGARVARRTIEEHLKRIPDALERRAKTST